MKPRVLLVDDDRAFRLSTSALLEPHFDVTAAADGTEAVDCLGRGGFDLMMLDVRMPGIGGVDLVEVLRSRGEGVPILMISGFGTVETAVRALHVGADDFLTKPVEPEVLIERAKRLIEVRPQGGGTDETILARSASMKAILADIERVADSDATVLVTGETGTGKELVARAIHERSSRSARPFVAINSAALAEGTLESQLFGHVKGAFTGADQDAEGLFAAADGGTVFLDEVGDVSLSAQKRLLRVLQEGEVLPVGATEPRRVDVRVVAATHIDLEAAVREKRFREDLYYRLAVFVLSLPPLRERREDIPLLIEHFLEGSGAAPGPGLSPLALRRLLDHDWPGNIRQLFSVLESARIRSGGEMIQLNHLPADVRGEDDRPAYRAEDTDGEPLAIEEALRQAGGRKAEAARLLGMSRTTLWRRMKELGLDSADD